MAQEIERKFLVSGDQWADAIAGIEGKKIVQGYIPTSIEGGEARVRIKGDRAFLTFKRDMDGTSLTRHEYEYEIPVSDAEELLRLFAAEHMVSKTRYAIPLGNLTWELDVFDGAHDGLILAEVEMDSETQQIALPEWVGPEVTDDKAYKNKNLAMKGLPAMEPDGISGRNLTIARIKPMNNTVPPIGYGGTQRVMAQLTALEATTKADHVRLYASADSKIVEYTQAIAEDMGLNHTISEDGNTIHIQNANGEWGSVTLRSTGVDHTDELDETQRLFDLMIADEKAAPSDIVHLHDRRWEGALVEAGLDNVICTEHTSRAAFHGVSEKPYLQVTLPYGMMVTDEDDVAAHYPLVAISDAHAADLEAIQDVDILGVARHGIYEEGWDYNPDPAGYLFFIGRFNEEKGTHRAIEIAKQSGKNLVIAGTTSFGSEDFYENVMVPNINIFAPELSDQLMGASSEEAQDIMDRLEAQYRDAHPDHEGPLIICVNEASDEQKRSLYRHAGAMLMPLSWPEPLGLVMIESMAVGTPVIAYEQYGERSNGSVAEVVDEGQSGFKIIAETEEAGIAKAVEAVKRLPELSRQTVRDVFDARWAARHEIDQMEHLFEKFLRGKAQEQTVRQEQQVANGTDTPLLNDTAVQFANEPGASAILDEGTRPGKASALA